jgi:hypothetical protein
MHSISSSAISGNFLASSMPRNLAVFRATAGHEKDHQVVAWLEIFRELRAWFAQSIP